VGLTHLRWAVRADGTFAMSIGTIAFFLAAGIITIPLAVRSID
jgi:hypothetical protein